MTVLIIHRQCYLSGPQREGSCRTHTRSRATAPRPAIEQRVAIRVGRCTTIQRGIGTGCARAFHSLRHTCIGCRCLVRWYTRRGIEAARDGQANHRPATGSRTIIVARLVLCHVKCTIRTDGGQIAIASRVVRNNHLGRGTGKARSGEIKA